MSRPFCFVASPFAGVGATPEECAADMVRNIHYAEMICRRVALETKLIPFAPHLVFPSFLNEHNLAERDRGIGYANRILPLCSFAIFAVPPWREAMSTGMRFEEKAAAKVKHLLRGEFRGAADGPELAFILARILALVG